MSFNRQFRVSNRAVQAPAGIAVDLADWREFPIISKKEMMENFNQLNTCGVDRDAAFAVAIRAEEQQLQNSAMGDITVGLSSGTSNNRGLFLVSPHEQYSWAGAMLAKMLPRSLLSQQKVAFFFRTTSSLYNSIKSKSVQFEYYHLLSSMEDHILRLNTQQPTLLVAPPSMLRKLAVEVNSKRLIIKPEKIVSIAEVLDPIDERFISEVFKQNVHQVYQATEGFLGTTCKHGTFHLNEDLLVIQKEPIPGSPHKFYPIITDFSRVSQPILRYRLNDILHEYEGQCPCGSVFIAVKFIEGRSDDIFYFYQKDKLKPLYPDFIRRSIISSSIHIEEYFAIQQSPHELEIALKIDNKCDQDIYDEVRIKLLNLFKDQDVEVPNITFIPYERGNTTKKLRRIERRFTVEGI